MRNDHYKISGGHNDSYFIIIDNKGNARIGTDGLPVPNRTLQLNEFVAHLNEIYWLDNDVWKFFDEEFYKEARKVMNKAFK